MQLNQNMPITFWLAGRKAVAICDPEDYHRVSQYRWQLRTIKGRSYVYARFCGRKIYLHRFILPVDGNIRFADGNPLNVTKKNLVTAKEVSRG